MGNVGYSFSDFSHKYFGYLSYVYLLLLIFPLYAINFKKNIDQKDLILNVLVVFLLLFVCLIFQALILENPYTRGEIGNILVDSLSPVIGRAGLYFFVLVGFIISVLVLFENSDFDIEDLKKLKNKIKLRNSLDIKRIENKRREKRVEETTKEVLNSIDKKLNKTIPEVKEIKTTPDNSNKNVATITPEIYENIEEIKDTNIYESSLFDSDDFEKDIQVVESHGIIVDELEENKKLLAEIEVGKTEKPKNFELPPTSFFQNPPKDNKSKVSEAFIDQKIGDLLDKLAMFKIEGDVVRTYTGPVVTTFEFKPAPNVKVSKILSLQDDLAMALKAQTIRIQAPIPGKDVVGIEVPNEDTQTIYLKEMLESEIFQNSISPLTMILGKDIVGKPFITDLKKLPHLLIAGTTGSGKSVGINSMILSLLYKNSPDNLRLVMIDPKMLEFSMYNDIPHLLTPVITKASDAINALANMVSEMERRYTLMSKTKTKNIENYNEKAKNEGYEIIAVHFVLIY